MLQLVNEHKSCESAAGKYRTGIFIEITKYQTNVFRSTIVPSVYIAYHLIHHDQVTAEIKTNVAVYNFCAFHRL